MSALLVRPVWLAYSTEPVLTGTEESKSRTVSLRCGRLTSVSRVGEPSAPAEVPAVVTVALTLIEKRDGRA
ncbi:hypothetical protein D3C80_2055540 [compost metagenome]